MYPTQQLAYSLNIQQSCRQYHSAAISNDNDLFFIGNQKLTYFSTPSMHHRQHTTTTTSVQLLPKKHISTLLPTTGHTTHWIDNALISIFGKPNQPSITIIDTIHHHTSSLSVHSSSSPSKRYAHTSTLVRSKTNNSTQLFLIGGASIIENQTVQADIWKLDWDTKYWYKVVVHMNAYHLGLMGHSTISFRHHQQPDNLLTCFGADPHRHIFYNHCTTFDTERLSWKKIDFPSSSSSQVSLIPRIFTSMVSTNDTHAILYGGLSETSTLLNDIWWIHINFSSSSSDTTITFTPLTSWLPRAGHVALMISDSLMLVDGGLLDSTENDTMILDLTTLKDQTVSTSLHNYYSKRQLEDPSSIENQIQKTNTNNSSTDSGGLGGGAIAGIIVAVIFTFAISITLFIVYQRRQRRQRSYDLHSRAARFSLSTPPRPSESNTEGQQQQQRRSIILKQPEAAKTRLSHMSFGSEFNVALSPNGSRSSVSLPSRSKTTSASPTINNHTDLLLDSPSRQLYTNWICETPIPSAGLAAFNSEMINNNNNKTSVDPRHTSMYINQSISPNGLDHDDDEEDDNDSGKKRSSRALKRLRHSIFKPLETMSSITDKHNEVSSSTYSLPHLISTSRTQSATIPGMSTTLDDRTTTTPITNTKRRSSMFGLSRFLNLGDSNGDDHSSKLDATNSDPSEQQQQLYQHNHLLPDARTSLGSKSVASLQWVEFNNDMDFSANVSSRHLAVMNPRQSTTTISSISGFGTGGSIDDSSTISRITTGTSPRNTIMNRQQHPNAPYRLSQREMQSWNDARLSWLATSPPLSSAPLTKQ
ncbi:uncharacterized protein BX664DRAFT_340951 [Halteromyces radiatus]|uniref:uncharacterized protein n=1 Tax=Halteromyces radiatus TaxID=101107 RepID=UPI00221F6937|nr:uncharacterized protein BX664DRAFT_340951 [Halteromyces radiatus]KAI8081662.1 hypothetical protein BX664DRAFT_340951 [Halteromyces radiatus]